MSCKPDNLQNLSTFHIFIKVAILEYPHFCAKIKNSFCHYFNTRRAGRYIAFNLALTPHPRNTGKKEDSVLNPKRDTSLP